MSGRGAADIEPELLRSEPGPLPGEFLESKDERLNSDAPRTPVGAQPTAAGQPKRGRFPVRRRTLKRQLGELQAELFSYERQFERAQADLQDLRGQLLERKRKLEQTERALEQEAAQRSAAQASLQAREETLTTARDHLAQLQAELPASERQRLELQAALEAACERINQLERARTPQDSLLDADVGGEREGSADQAGHSLAVMEKHYALTIAAYRGVPLTDAAEVIRKARAARVLQRGEAAENLKGGKALEF